MDTTQKQLTSMVHATDNMADRLYMMMDSLEDAEYQLAHFTNPKSFEFQDDTTLDDDIHYVIESAEASYNSTLEHLRRFDAALANLIYLRGQLAEDTGVPMMSHLGTNGFGRHSSEFKM